MTGALSWNEAFAWSARAIRFTGRDNGAEAAMTRLTAPNTAMMQFGRHKIGPSPSVD
jgi:hypothetical protein